MRFWINGKKVYEFLDKNQIRERVSENREDAVVVTDNRSVVEMINPGFTRLFGYTEEEALGKPVSDLIIQEQAVADLRKSRHSSFGAKNNEKKIIKSRKNGRKVGVLGHITPIMMDNKPVGSFAFYRVLGN